MVKFIRNLIGDGLTIYNRNKEVVNYLIFGFLTTVINLLVYFILTVSIFNVNNGFELQLANIISWIVAVLFAYVTNRKFVFNSNNSNKIKEISNFFLARIVTLIVDMMLMYFGVNILNINDKFIKIISQVIVIIVNYIFSKLFVFKKSDI